MDEKAGVDARGLVEKLGQVSVKGRYPHSSAGGFRLSNDYVCECLGSWEVLCTWQSDSV